MREALGLRSDGTRVTPSPTHRPDRVIEHGTANPRRHRFVQEGEVPVEVMTLREHGPRGAGGFGGARVRVDDSAVAAERLAREQAERAFAEANERLREARTKLGHAELARDEALALATGRLGEIESVRQQLAAAEAELVVQRRATATAAVAAAPKPAPKPKVKAAAAPRGRQKAPKPVRWWIKSTPAAR